MSYLGRVPQRGGRGLQRGPQPFKGMPFQSVKYGLIDWLYNPDTKYITGTNNIMAKAANNIPLRVLSGRLWDSVRGGSIGRSPKPDFRDRKFSQANPPLIRRIEQSAERILVQAGDPVRVTKVRLTLLDQAGEVLEMGEAIRKEGSCWEFICRSPGLIILVEAWDLDGNRT